MYMETNMAACNTFLISLSGLVITVKILNMFGESVIDRTFFTEIKLIEAKQFKQEQTFPEFTNPTHLKEMAQMPIGRENPIQQ